MDYGVHICCECTRLHVAMIEPCKLSACLARVKIPIHHGERAKRAYFKYHPAWREQIRIITLEGNYGFIVTSMELIG